ncbi:(2Fe-2S)-binding protein [Orrella sp. JC864]|uniref:(2Fe-2S)-binding protein n=1 Tax=Orrella sp. JC864 TaxID=3120298 RepID=UPI00300B9BF7
MNGQTTRIQFTLNGQAVQADIQTHHNALDVLRNTFALFGARESCGQGLCGCCTIIVDGKSVSGCLYLAAALDGTEVRTIESLDADGELHPVQQAFIDCDAFQCGFCTSGFILMSQQLLAENPRPSEAEIKNYLSGNLCRCAAYPEIIEAVQLAATRINASKEAM